MRGGRGGKRSDERHEPSVGGDHRREGGPDRSRAGGRGGGIPQGRKTRGIESSAKGRSGLGVGVDEQKGDDFVRVGVHPDFDAGEPGGERAGVEEGAVGVAEAEGRVDEVDLGLEEADSGGERNGGVEVLVSGERVGGGCVAEEGGVVGAHVGDVVVGAWAEEGGVVACYVAAGGGGGGWGGGGESCG